MKICKDLNAIASVAQEVLDNCAEHAIVILQGDLAAGKTTLVKAIAKELGVTEDVTSPTFSLQQCYGSNLYHYDIYNQGIEQFMSLGLFEELEKEGLHLIEWGDESLAKLCHDAGFNTLKVVISKEEDQRCYRIENA